MALVKKTEKDANLKDTKDASSQKIEEDANLKVALKESKSADPWNVFDGPAAEKREPVKGLGRILPTIQRNPKCPGLLALSAGDRKSVLEEDERNGVERGAKEPKVYILCFSGAGDSVSSGWAKVEYTAAPYMEIATYQWPGHESRQKEECAQSIQELGADAFETFREAMLTGNFMIVGHAAGTLIASYVCMRAEHELGRQPLAMFMLDRAPPDYKIWTENAMDQLTKKPKAWFEVTHSELAKSKDAKLDQQALSNMWSSDERLNNDTMPLGDYKFPCKIWVFFAMEPFISDPNGEAQTEITKYHLSGRVNQSKLEWFQDWSKWSDRVTMCKISTDSEQLKCHNQVFGVVYRVVKDTLKRQELRLMKL